MSENILAFINKLEGFKTAIKNIHWNSANLSQHKLCDDIASQLSDFQDQVAEVEQSINGNLPFNQLKPTEYKITNLVNFVNDVIAAANAFYKTLEDKGDDYIGMRSDVESFLSSMQRSLYLVKFTLKEQRLRNIVSESIRKVLSEGNEWEQQTIKKKYTSKKTGTKHCVEISITPALCDGYGEYGGEFEYWVEGQDDETYCSGGLDIRGKDVIDFSGVYYLPVPVKKALSEAGYNVKV